MIWRHRQNELTKIFFEKLQKFHPTIKFTYGYFRKKVHSLDVQVILEKNEILNGLCVKEMDTH